MTLNKLRFQYRRATWRKRLLPDFLIVGAQKSGTTSLYAYLSQHPEIVPSYERKEIHFFDGGLEPDVDNYKKGQSWYRAHFPLNKTVNDSIKTFEASPLYIFNPLAAKRIYDLIPRVKIIVILRNPTERAISHYFHEIRKGREDLPILNAFQQEEARMQPFIDKKDYKSNEYIHYSYKSRGLYRAQIERYLEYFSPEQILILNSKELFDSTENMLRKVFSFLGVDETFKAIDLKARHVAENKTEVDNEVYAYLNDFFLPHNQALYELVGKSYNW